MQELIRLIREADQVYLITHVNPDGDAIGSLTALAVALEDSKKPVTAVLPSGVPPAFHYLESSLALHRKELPPPVKNAAAVCIVLDAPDSARTGFPEVIAAYAAAGKLGFIDHHPSGDLNRLTPVSHHSVAASSTAELLHPLLTALELRLTPEICTALLTGIYTDTGGFQFSNTTTHTLELAAELMRRGAKLNTITQEITQHKTIANLRLLGTALERLRLSDNGKAAVSVLDHEDITRLKANADDTAGIVGQMNVLPESAFTLLLTEAEAGTIRGSLRSGNGPAGKKVNVGRLAKLLGGGGHPRAAGFLLSGNLSKTRHGEWKIT